MASSISWLHLSLTSRSDCGSGSFGTWISGCRMHVGEPNEWCYIGHEVNFVTLGKLLLISPWRRGVVAPTL